MVQNFRYRSPTTPGETGWDQDLGNTVVRLGREPGFVQEAELGAVGIGSLALDDPIGTLGHNGDAIVGLKQFDAIELTAPSGNRRIFTGYIADRRYFRGTQAEAPSLITGAARVIDMTLVDINSFLSFRVFLPTTVDSTSDFNRPAETDVARITAMLTTVDFLSTTLFDGLVSSDNPVNMDAVDYTGQRPVDVLNDCAQQSGKNFFVFYDEDGTYTGAAGRYGLFYDFNDSPVYPSPMSVSNVLADVNDTTVFSPFQDATLVRDPSRVISGVLFMNGSNSVYRNQLSTSYIYGYRDAIGDTANLKTVARITARADRYLQENSTEDDRLTWTCKQPAAYVNSCLPGQYLPVKFTHLPGYESYRQVRVLQRIVAQDEMDDTHYNVRYEATPVQFAQTSGAFQDDVPGLHHATPTLPHATTPGDLLVLAVSQVRSNALPEPIGNPTLAAGAGGSSAAWTTVAYKEAYSSTQYGGPGGAVSFSLYWRRVDTTERTTTPVIVSAAAVAGLAGAWLWEIAGVSNPTTSTSFTTDTVGDVLDGGTATLGSGMSGFVFGGMAIQGPDYECGIDVTPVVGTTVQDCDSHNITLLQYGGDSRHHGPPWVWMGYTTSGSALKAQLTYPSCFGTVLNKFGVCGVAMVIPQAKAIQTIPYPANRIG